MRGRFWPSNSPATRDGKTLVSSSRDHTIKLWDVATGELKRTLKDHTADVYTVAFSHDGKLMASGRAPTGSSRARSTSWVICSCA